MPGPEPHPHTPKAEPIVTAEAVAKRLGYTENGHFPSFDQLYRMTVVRQGAEFFAKGYNVPPGAKLSKQVIDNFIDHSNAMELGVTLPDLAKELGLIDEATKRGLDFALAMHGHNPDFAKYAGKSAGQIMVDDGYITQAQREALEKTQKDVIKEIDRRFSYPTSNDLHGMKDEQRTEIIKKFAQQDGLTGDVLVIPENIEQNRPRWESHSPIRDNMFDSIAKAALIIAGKGEPEPLEKFERMAK